MPENREPPKQCINRDWCKRHGQCDHYLTHLEGCEAAAWSKARGGIHPSDYRSLTDEERETIENGIK